MKPLKLTKEHEVKFLEMCNTLFPERRNIVLTKHNTIRFDYKIISGGESWSSDKSIHWFEFCMTYLVEAIIATYVVNKDGEKVYKRTLNDSLSTFYLQTLLFSRGYDKQHPIDYLYNEFKKLNK